MENKIKALGLLSLIAVAAVIGGILMTARADDNSTTTSTNTAVTTETTTNTTTSTASNTPIPTWICGGMGFGRHGGMGFGRPGGPGGFGGLGQIEVSADFTANVTNIAKADSDVQNLLANGYNITMIRPIIKTVIDAQGNVAAKATSAVLMLQNGTTGHASVLVDLEKGKVTEIITTTRTVIQKP
jgi:hypothetical protein